MNRISIDDSDELVQLLYNCTPMIMLVLAMTTTMRLGCLGGDAAWTNRIWIY
jgi:hypothetical protein